MGIENPLGDASGDVLLGLIAVNNRGWADVVSLERDTDLEPIRNDPAFQTLLREFRQLVGKRS